MAKRFSFILFACLAIIIGLYPTVYLFVDKSQFGLLTTKSAELLANLLWNIGFYVHIVFGGIALLVGWSQFSKKLLQQNQRLHRRLGKLYVLPVWLSAIAGIGIGFSATGGAIATIGFVSLGII